MKSKALIVIVFQISIMGCMNQKNVSESDLVNDGITVCRTPLSLLEAANEEPITKFRYPRMVYADEPSTFQKILANDNKVPAGVVHNDTLILELNFSWGDFYMEDEAHPGLRMTAIGEKGKQATIPAPLIRAKTGTIARITVFNSLPDSAISIFGLQSRPSEKSDSLYILPGESKRVEFSVGAPGTYLYWARLGNRESMPENGEEEQLSGAFVIDPAGTKVKDRILVMNIFQHILPEKIDSLIAQESLTINGKSWPYTELFEPSVGDTIRWKVINSSIRNHPMHLHGFYYDVLSSGSVLKDEIYDPEHRRTVVTEFMTGRTTMEMLWVPTREGRWLFHCHISFHVAGAIRLRDGRNHEHDHMAGLVVGINVKTGPSDLIWKGEPREITLYANNYESDGNLRNGFSTDEIFYPRKGEKSTPGPMLILRQYQPTFVTLVNRMVQPTSVHWHGLELQSWADGVPGWSLSDGKFSPVVRPGEKFTYKLALMRAGTFIYHSHLDDVNQIPSGLYGPMIVLGENERYEPETDHTYVVGWKTPDQLIWEDLELNGSQKQPDIHTHVGVKHRLRLINIAPAGRIRMRVEKEGKIKPIRIIAKDGYNLPEMQKVFVNSTFRYGVGETADFEFTPEGAGLYQLYFWNNSPQDFWVQNWIVDH